MKLSFAALSFVLLPFAALTALAAQSRGNDRPTLEAGITYSTGLKSNDQFAKGIGGLQTRFASNRFNHTTADPFDSLESWEGWFRYDNIIGRNHWIGLAIGYYEFPTLTVREFRFHEEHGLDGVLDTRWNFQTPYFLFTYNYHQPLYFLPSALRQVWRGELGVGYGFVTDAVWRVSGYDYNLYREQPQLFNTRHRARYGQIVRLEAGLHGRFGAHLVVRTGVRLAYSYSSIFRGEMNNMPGEWYYNVAGGITPVSAANIIWTSGTASTVTTSVDGEILIPFLRSEPRLTVGSSELYLSIAGRY